MEEYVSRVEGKNDLGHGRSPNSPALGNMAMLGYTCKCEGGVNVGGSIKERGGDGLRGWGWRLLKRVGRGRGYGAVH